MKEKTADLCGKCAAQYRESFRLTVVPGGVNKKVDCSACGKRRYGETYMLSKK